MATSNENDEDTTVARGPPKPNFRTRLFSNKKFFILLFGLAGCCFSSTFAYFNGTITTMEKRFKMPSKTTGIISIGNDVTKLLASVVLNYYASKGHRPRWIAFGLCCIATFCFLNSLPHGIYGPGEDALQLTMEHGELTQDPQNKSVFETRNKNLCNRDDDRKCNLEEGSIVPPIIWFVSQFISGIGGVLFFSLGYSYLDDNIKKSKSPTIISATYIIKMLGPALGYATVSICLKIYIAPNLTPIITSSDPRWLGAWWLGWLFLGSILLIFAMLMLMLPKSLPRTEEIGKKPQIHEPTEASLDDLIKTVKRLMTNKVYIFNQMSSIFHVFGFMPFRMFLPKYIETQYRQSASIASFVTGTAGLMFSASGIIIAGLVVQKLKPKARYMALWNTFVDIVGLMGVLTYSFIGCKVVDEQIPAYSEEVLNSNCNADCDCDYVKFSPVCSVDRMQTFISACHAGCRDYAKMSNGSTIFSNCSCIDDLQNGQFGTAFSGPCPADCLDKFYAFIAIICFLKFIGALGRITSFLVAIRCVEERDKTVSLGIKMGTVSLFALIPAPIFFGHVLDSTCLVWGKTCTGKGNCWLFNSKLMRERLVYLSTFFITLEILSDIGVWWNLKGLNIFDDKEDSEKDNK